MPKLTNKQVIARCDREIERLNNLISELDSKVLELETKNNRQAYNISLYETMALQLLEKLQEDEDFFPLSHTEESGLKIIRSTLSQLSGKFEPTFAASKESYSDEDVIKATKHFKETLNQKIQNQDNQAKNQDNQAKNQDNKI